MPNTHFSPPPRLRVHDSLGRPQTLGTGAEAFDMWPASPHNTRLLVLGLGPYSPSLPDHNGMANTGAGVFVDDIARQYTDICWLDCADFHAALTGGTGQRTGQSPNAKASSRGLFEPQTRGGTPENNTQNRVSPPVPSHWRRVTPAQALAEAPDRDIRLYRQNLRLFPEFWGPLWANISRQRLRLPLWPKAAPTVVLPHEATALLARELDAAFTQAGFQVLHWPYGTSAGQISPAGHTPLLPQAPQAAALPQAATTTHMAYWQHLLREQRPALVLSLNGQGLDAGGEAFHLLQACQVPVALWFVDNPWHILSRFRLPWWRKAQLFCTDAAFIQPLQDAGASRVAHIPLAVAPHMWAAQAYDGPRAMGIPHGPLEKVLFVGSLAFPQRQAFFGAASVPPQLLQQAFALLESGVAHSQPHATWWAQHLHAGPLWPGHAARAVGLGAEECTLRKRLLWLQAAAECGLSHYGHHADEGQALSTAAGYTTELGDVLHNSRPPVEYYTTLPRLYATARYTLNVTSLLLPHGLTQRHFDVWAAGGFLLTDITAGLEIFPAELRKEICVPHPRALAERIRALDGQEHLRREVQAAWQQHLREHHGYAQRVASICQHLGQH